METFFQAVPVRCIDWSRLVINQERLLDETVASARNKKYPVSPRYSLSFLKSLMAYCESHNLEIHENVYGIYSELLSHVDSTFAVPPPHYKTYFVDGDAITVYEDQAKISAGTTGLRVWPASLRFIAFLSNNLQIIHGKSVVELGAGVGLLGLACASLGASAVCVTDFDGSVIQRLQMNLEIYKDTHRDNVAQLDCMELDWSTTTQESLASTFKNINKPFVLVCTDVVYDPSVVPHLSRTLGLVINSGMCECAYIWSTIRNQDTFDLFCASLDEVAWNEVVVPDTVSGFYIDEPDTMTCLIRIPGMAPVQR